MAEFGKRMGLVAALSGAVLVALGCVVVPTETPGSVSSSTAPPAPQSSSLKTDGGKGDTRRGFEPKRESLQELKERYGLSGEVVDADSFMKDLRPEEYVSQAQAQEWIQTAARVELSNKKYPNSFEREAALSEFSKSYISPLVTTKSWPDYLVFRTNFPILPSSYITAKQLYLLEPTLAYQKYGIVQVPIERDCSRANCAEWSYFRSTEHAVQPKYIFRHRVFVEQGTTIEQSNWSKYTKRETNRFAIVPLTHQEFRAILADGHNPQRNPNVSFYAGWSIAKVDKSKSACTNSNRPYQIPSVTCTIQTNPVKYVVENFNGKARAEFDPKMTDMLNL